MTVSELKVRMTYEELMHHLAYDALQVERQQESEADVRMERLRREMTRR